MRTILALAVALVLGSAPLAAQQSAAPALAQTSTAAAIAEPAALPIASDARLAVSQQEMTKSLETKTSAAHTGVGSRSWLYLVAAIAAGIIIAAVVLD